MIGRKKEVEKIERLMRSERSEFLAVTGRRRVGKTYLIDTLLSPSYCFSMTGIQNGSMATQLANFSIKLSEYDGTGAPKTLQNWQFAFAQLKSYLKTLDKSRKQVIFIDELPWVATPKSGFVQMLAHFWNDYLSKESHFILVICGSATSWISQKVIRDTGGLHNRVTENIHVYPFTLSETSAFLASKGLQYSLQDMAKVYMILGGIPYYLENLRKGESVAAAIERICFEPTGILYYEYDNLFKALFNNAGVHQQIVAALAARQDGMTSEEICRAVGFSSANGSYNRALEELMISDFVVENNPWKKKKRGSIYRLTDEYSIFYHRFIQPNKKYSAGIWQQLSESQSFKIWIGFAFETLCLKHIDKIKQALGISAVYTDIYSLRVPGTDDTDGFQIDLMIDRKDDCINLCEVKFHNGPFVMTKAWYQRLLEKRQRFIAFSGTKKTVFLTLITNHGVAGNTYSNEIMDAEVLLEQLV